MKSSGNHSISGKVHIDEFVVRGRKEGKIGRSYNSKKKKVVYAVEFTDGDKVKRMYSIKIDNYSAKELERLFDKHISSEATITTDKRKGYRPLMELYYITQINSNKGLNFKVLHTMIHQIKSWIRATYSWGSEFNIDRYLNEFCCGINRPQMKNNIFNNLVRKMIVIDKIFHAKLI